MEKWEEAPKPFESIDWNKWLGIGIGLMILSFFGVPICITQMYWGVDYTGTGQIGDTIGGIMGPIMAGIGGILTFIAFREQIKANEKQRVSIDAQLGFNEEQKTAFKDQKTAADEQIKTMQIERFESRLFSMLEHHRNNVSEIVLRYRFSVLVQPGADDEDEVINTIQVEYRGREAFEIMDVDFRGIYQLIKAKNDTMTLARDKEWIPIANDRAIYEIAYFIFYYGVNQDGQQLSKEVWPESSLGQFQQCFQLVFEYNRKMKAKVMHDGFFTMGDQLRNPGPNPLPSMHLAPQYHLGFGHYQWLSHCFRNAYAILEYLDSFKDEKLISAEERERYPRFVRSNLSIPEQVVFYFDAISNEGKGWFANERIIERYRLIRNVPLPVVSFCGNPFEVFREKNEAGEYVFEFSDPEKRLNGNVFTSPQQG